MRSDHPRLIKAMHEGALFLMERVEKDGWVWSWGYLLEHARCAGKLVFGNVSVEAYQQQHPEIVQWVEQRGRRQAGFDLSMPEPVPAKPAGLPPPTNAHYDAKGRLIHNRCAVCWSPDAPFGDGVSLKDGVLGMWYCKEHWKGATPHEMAP